MFKENRSRHGKIRSDLATVYYAGSPEQVVSALAGSGEVLDELITVTETFLHGYAEIKREKKLIDFPDLEHYALRILRDENGERTDAAKELARNFECVMVDEYQDSNYLQEAILTAVTRMEEGSDNYFCVGDVKQSIYGFRHARPDLFMRKFYDYAGEGGGDPISRGVRIDLLKNFRSRKEVLDFSNGLFRQIMRREIGGVDYDRDAELFYGASYPETDGGEYDTEILIAEAKEENADGSTFLEDTRRDALKQLEARMIAERIRELVRHEKITDTKTGKDRPIEYRDIVILLRTMSGYADTFAEVLTACGIPAFSTAKTEYFSAMEVMTILNYLSIVDNPEQDIPFTAVLRSPIVGLSAEEIARIRIVSGSPSSDRDAKFLTMAECARRYLAFHAGAEAGAEGELSGKLERFFSFYGRIRESVPYTPIHELIWEVLTGTGYLDYVSALPGGAQRAANLRMLVEKAIAYEGTSYVGLFNFIRYIRNLRKYDVDFGEVNVLGESENVVRLISIHKSKGLEYPIVFVAGCSKQFNLQDIRASLLIDPEMGLASDYTDLSRRVKYATVKKNAVARKKRREAAGEELRVLYVALTRAKQKLIVTGTIGTEKEFEDLVNLPQPLSEILFEENYILNAKNMLTWILPAASRMQERAAMEGSRCPVRIELVKPSSLVGSAVREGSRVGETLRILSEMNGEAVYDPAVRRIIEERFSYQYPFDGRGAVPVKVSVSELKKESMRDEDAAEVFAEEIVVPFIPSFIREGVGQHEDAQTPDGQITLDAWIRMKEGSGEDLLLESSASSGGPGGAARGTAYHKVMELLDYSGFSPDQKESTEAVILGQMREFVRSGKMTEEDIRLVDPKNIARFVKSSLGGRMRQAALAGKLRREQPFVLAVKASEIDPSYPEDEDIIVQGIMDAFFYEGEGEKEEIVLLDYKTDRVPELAVLGKRYKVQLDSYAEALTRVTGKKVKEKIIWSFGWGRQLLL
jgi:ATP-dependent helicase/nuclease subunit A